MATSDENVQELLKRARGGDAEARTSLLEHVRSYLKLLARLHLDNRLQRKVDDSDLVQDTLIQADRDFAAFRGTTEEELLAWLRSIMAHTAANLVRHFYRTQKRTINLEESLLEELDHSAERVRHIPLAPGKSPSQLAMQREEVIRLAEAMDRLPEDYREVIILRHLKGLPLQEVAKEMNRTIDSVRKLWARALVLLRKDLS